MKIAVCIQLFYPDMFDIITSYLNNLKHPYKLYITLTNGFYNNSDIEKIKNYKPDSKIIFVENKGVDVGGFLNTLKHIDKDTDLILKIHTKKGIGTVENPSSSVKRKGYNWTIKYSKLWFHDLMRGVLNDKNQVEKIINTFQTNSKCGMVGYKLHQKLRPNEEEIVKLLNKMGISQKLIGSNFVGGTMFWVRYEIIKNYLTDELIEELLDKMLEGYIIEPSIQHALERIFGYMVYHDKQEIMIIN